MGSSSKDTSNVQSSELEASSGLHFLEVHFPTLGAGMGLVIIDAVMLYFRIHQKREKKHQLHRGRSPDDPLYGGVPAFPTFPFGIPKGVSIGHDFPDHRMTYYPAYLDRSPPRIREVTSKELDSEPSKKTKKIIVPLFYIYALLLRPASLTV